jgi:hypothetical protein
MGYALPRYIGMLKANSGAVLCKPEFFEDRENKALGKPVRTVALVLKFPDGPVQLRYVGTRSNGMDQPFWPKNLMTEIVA